MTSLISCLSFRLSDCVSVSWPFDWLINLSLCQYFSERPSLSRSVCASADQRQRVVACVGSVSESQTVLVYCAVVSLIIHLRCGSASIPFCLPPPSVFQWTGFIEERRDPKGRISYVGFSIEILNMAAQRMNFTWVFLKYRYLCYADISQQ